VDKPLPEMVPETESFLKGLNHKIIGMETYKKIRHEHQSHPDYYGGRNI
jgi:hypothetical protein